MDDAENDDDYELSAFKELDPELEKKLCDLWDITVEKDVCACLDEFNAMQIFEGYMRKFDGVYPRAIEILIGIMGNMSMMNADISLKLVSNTSFIHYLLFKVLSRMEDVQTVIQVIRVFSLFLTDWNEPGEGESNEAAVNQRALAKSKFIQLLKNELVTPSDTMDTSQNLQAIIEKFFFILEQSLNPTLLDTTISFILNLLDNDDQILDLFAGNVKSQLRA